MGDFLRRHPEECDSSKEAIQNKESIRGSTPNVKESAGRLVQQNLRIPAVSRCSNARVTEISIYSITGNSASHGPSCISSESSQDIETHPGAGESDQARSRVRVALGAMRKAWHMTRDCSSLRVCGPSSIAPATFGPNRVMCNPPFGSLPRRAMYTVRQHEHC